MVNTISSLNHNKRDYILFTSTQYPVPEVAHSTLCTQWFKFEYLLDMFEYLLEI